MEVMHCLSSQDVHSLMEKTGLKTKCAIIDIWNQRENDQFCSEKSGIQAQRKRHLSQVLKEEWAFVSWLKLGKASQAEGTTDKEAGDSFTNLKIQKYFGVAGTQGTKVRMQNKKAGERHVIQFQMNLDIRLNMVATFLLVMRSHSRGLSNGVAWPDLCFRKIINLIGQMHWKCLQKVINSIEGLSNFVRTSLEKIQNHKPF